MDMVIWTTRERSKHKHAIPKEIVALYRYGRTSAVDGEHFLRAVFHVSTPVGPPTGVLFMAIISVRENVRVGRNSLQPRAPM